MIVFFAVMKAVAAAFNARCSVAVRIPYVIRVSGVQYLSAVGWSFRYVVCPVGPY